MAIIEGRPGIGVTVVVAGRDATEYNDPDALEHQPNEAASCLTSTKYIECIDGANFSVNYHVSEYHNWGYRGHSLRFDLKVDGILVFSRITEKHHLIDGHTIAKIYEKESYNRETRQWSGQKFKFSAITTVDDVKKDRVEGDMKIAKDLGIIEVKVYRCINKGDCGPSNHGHNAIKSIGRELSEKALKGKAISHGTSFSSPNIIKTPRFVDATLLAEDNGPIAVFRFHYRSRDALKREMIIPRTPSRSPTSRPDIARMSRAEVERLAQERLEQLQEDGNVKQERKPIIKRELKRRASEVIDLSDENAQFSRRSKPKPEFIDLTDD
ncbi:hypothetical protein F4781DRAFT_390782 [Annulohypoxylon bovei var. microspora]|nr:hypothetical protein F4781DRAFT_390782 [Annulohypoxylon bovei var. microspora]